MPLGVMSNSDPSTTRNQPEDELEDLAKEVEMDPKVALEEQEEPVDSDNTQTMPQVVMATMNSYFSPASSRRDSSPPGATRTVSTCFPLQSQ